MREQVYVLEVALAPTIGHEQTDGPATAMSAPHAHMSYELTLACFLSASMEMHLPTVGRRSPTTFKTTNSF